MNNTTSTSFVFMQWNILAQSCADSEFFPYVQKEHLDYKYRQDSFKKIIERVKPDLCCFQEVDDFDTTNNIMKSVNPDYDSVYEQKAKSTHGGERQGLAIFYDKKVFNLNSSFRQVFSNPTSSGTEIFNQFAIGAILHHMASDSLIGVGTTHLKAGKENEWKRLIEIRCYLEMYEKLKTDVSTSSNSKSFILCGDFNSDGDVIKELRNNEELKEVIFESHPFSNLMVRSDKTKDVKLTIDFIFHSGNATVESKFNAFENVQVEEEKGFPNSTMPSDHVYLACKFKP